MLINLFNTVRAYGVPVSLKEFLDLLKALEKQLVFADWNDESLFYVPNITKISLLILTLIYLITRLIIVPKKKQILFRKYSLKEIIQFVFISILLDVIKLFAFLKTILKSFKK